MNNINYRSDIDGLRCIAIISIIIFHLFPNIFRGGFIGVDIFFVISGYLISKIIIKDLRQNSLCLIDFYLRRIRRLFPALIIVLISSYVVGWIFLYSDEFKNLGLHISGAGLFLTNLILWNESGYFDNISSNKNLLQLWSLGIEGQFYIIWPLILALIPNKKFYSVVIGIALISFYLNIKIANFDHVQVFYSPVTRFWELISGTLLVGIVDFKNKFHSNHSSLDLKNFYLINSLISTSGIIILVLGFVFLNANLNFPGYYALIPIIGTMCVIYAGPFAFLNLHFLSNKFIIFIGLISYPLYLWHWPILTFIWVIYGKDTELPLALKLVIIILSILLAWLTFRYIEKFFRSTSNYFSKTISLILLMALCGYIGFYTYKNNGINTRFINKSNAANEKDLLRDYRGSAGWICQNQFTNIELCEFKNQDTNVLFLGDSHIEPLYYGYLQKFPAGNVGMLGVSGCPPFFDIVSRMKIDIKNQSRCHDSISKILPLISNMSSIKDVYMSFRGPLYISGKGFGNTEEEFDWMLTSYTKYRKDFNTNTYKDVFFEEMDKLLGYLDSLNKNIVVILDNPELDFDIKTCLGSRSSLMSFYFSINFECRIDKEKYKRRFIEYKEIIHNLKAKYPKVRFYEPADYICDSKHCYGMLNGRLLYRDNDHLSTYGGFYILHEAGLLSNNSSEK